ncbi:MAG TPA: hypothetical protein VGP36_06765 [Mycobacteriales bacterium]|nr:hypothetical protein [Mycobacteriales bacterium]
MHVALQKGLQAAGSEDAVHAFAAVAQPQREQRADHQLTGQSDRHRTEVDPGFSGGLVGLRHEPLGRDPAGLDPDLAPTFRDVGAHHRVRHRIGAGVVLVQQPVEDPLGGVPLLARCIQIHPQHCIDRRLERIQLGRPRCRLLPRLRPRCRPLLRGRSSCPGYVRPR